MTFRGLMVNGRVELEPGAVIPNGTPLRIEPLSPAPRKGTNSRKGRATRKGLLSLLDLSISDSLPADLAAEHDHYIYGIPKRNSPTARSRARKKASRAGRRS